MFYHDILPYVTTILKHVVLVLLWPHRFACLPYCCKWSWEDSAALGAFLVKIFLQICLKDKKTRGHIPILNYVINMGE
jgi:hypothetical protein